MKHYELMISRLQLHNYLEAANDKKIKAIYTIIEKDPWKMNLNILMN